MMKINIKSNKRNDRRGRKSIRKQLNLSFMILILLSALILGVISISIAKNIISRTANEAVQIQATEVAKLEASRLKEKSAALETMTQLKEIQYMNWSIQRLLLASLVKNSDFSEIGILKPDGLLQYFVKVTTKTDASETFMKVIEEDKTAAFFEVNAETKETTLTQIVPIKKDDEVVGAIFGIRDGEYLSTIADETTFGKTGYGYIINENGTVIGHSNRARVGITPMEDVKSDSSLSSLAKFISKAVTDKAGSGSYTYDGVNYSGAFAPIEGTDWIFIVVANRSEVLEDIPGMTLAIIIAAMAVMIIAAFVTYLIGGVITKPIVKMSHYALTMGELDFRGDIDNGFLGRQDELGDLSRSMQNIIIALRNVIKNINNSSEQIAASSKTLSHTSQQTALSSSEVSKTVQEIAEGANEQAKSTEEGSFQASLLGNTIEKSKININKVGQSTNRVAGIIEEGLEEIDKLSMLTNHNTRAVEEIYQVVLKAAESSNKIGEASSVIESIAD
ncbi:MAG: chemotaxis protein, partial [Clostridiales bacterium]|nr:chemotaxis protein [Clostridiales bacterium]